MEMKKNQLLELRRQIVNATSPEMAKKLFYDKGMYPPRERIEKLLDPGTFSELDVFAWHEFQDFGIDQFQKSLRLCPRFCCLGRHLWRNAWKENMCPDGFGC